MTGAKSLSFRARWVGAGVLVVAGLAAIATIILSATDNARVELNMLARSNADERIWGIVEIEANAHKFQHAILNVERHEEHDTHHFTHDFEALKASLAQVCNGEEFASIKENPALAQALGLAEQVVMRIEPFVYSDLSNDPQAQTELRKLSFELTDAVEALSLSSLPAFAELAQAQRDRVAQSLVDLGVVIVILVIVLFCSVAILLYSIRAGAIRTREISSTRNRLNAMIGTSLDGILVVGREGEILDYNGAAQRIFGYSYEEAIGQTMSELIVPEHLREAHEAGMSRYLETREKRVVDQGLVQLEAIDKNGRLFPVELSISSAESDGGEIFVSYIRDISDRVAAQAELVDARDKAVAGEQAKAKFLAVMSHEMRTPLNGLLGSLQLLRGTKLNGRQRNFTEVMETSGHLLLEHVNNVLDISRADAGRVEAVNQAFDLEELLDEISTSFSGQAAARGNSLQVEKLGETSRTVHGDRGRLGQVLVNLVGNAIKFTNNGNVTLEVERAVGDDMLEFRVIDNGIGIAHDDQSRIFDDFVMIDSSYQREVEGTGLGLGIVRRLVGILGGEIGVESEPGEGSVFWLRIPMPAVHENSQLNEDVEAHQDHVSKSNMSVLLVEDNEINRLVAREMLLQFGCSIVEAKDGSEGVEKAGAAKFDLILCDISMPRMNGIEATSLIRAGDGPNKHTPIVALTAHALPDDKERFRTAGMTDVLVKPLTIEALERILVRTEQSTGQADGPNTQDALSALLGDERALEVLRQAKSELESGLQQIRDLIDQNAQREDLRQIAHKLCGIAAVVGRSQLHGKLTELETATLEADFPALKSMLEQLDGDLGL